MELATVNTARTATMDALNVGMARKKLSLLLQPQTNMENKEELEKLVEEFRGGFWSTTGQTFIELKQKQDKYLGDLFARIRVLAYKQGYMRGVEDALRVLPNKVVADADWNACLSKAHDAISKLKERI